MYKIMDRKINPEHRQAVAKLVKDLRDQCCIPDDIYQVLVNQYGKSETKLTNQIKRSMNSKDLVTKQDIKYPNKSSSRS